MVFVHVVVPRLNGAAKSRLRLIAAARKHGHATDGHVGGNAAELGC